MQGKALHNVAKKKLWGASLNESFIFLELDKWLKSSWRGIQQFQGSATAQLIVCHNGIMTCNSSTAHLMRVGHTIAK